MARNAWSLPAAALAGAGVAVLGIAFMDVLEGNYGTPRVADAVQWPLFWAFTVLGLLAAALLARGSAALGARGVARLLAAIAAGWLAGFVTVSFIGLSLNGDSDVG